MGKIISVTGLEGSGKSTFSANLALSLALKDKVVFVVPALLDYGGIQIFFGEVISNNKGIRAAIADTTGQPEKFLTQCKLNENIYILGVPNQSAETYRALFDEGVIEGVMRRLSSHADFIIVDGTAGTSNPITYYSLSEAIAAFEIVNPSAKGVMRVNAMRGHLKALCGGALYYLLSELNIGCDVHKFIVKADINPLATLPFVADAPALENESALIYKTKKGKQYKKVIDSIAGKILDAEGGY